MSLHQAASMSNLGPEAPEKSCESSTGTSPPTTGDDNSSCFRLDPCALAPGRQCAGRIRTPAVVGPALRPRPCWRPASPRAGAQACRRSGAHSLTFTSGWATGVAATAGTRLVNSTEVHRPYGWLNESIRGARRQLVATRREWRRLRGELQARVDEQPLRRQAVQLASAAWLAAETAEQAANAALNQANAERTRWLTRLEERQRLLAAARVEGGDPVSDQEALELAEAERDALRLQLAARGAAPARPGARVADPPVAAHATCRGRRCRRPPAAWPGLGESPGLPARTTGRPPCRTRSATLRTGPADRPARAPGAARERADAAARTAARRRRQPRGAAPAPLLQRRARSTC